jgi:hypothetical protein
MVIQLRNEDTGIKYLLEFGSHEFKMRLIIMVQGFPSLLASQAQVE